MLKVLELFAGTRSIGKAFEARGHEVYSVDYDRKFEDIDNYCDILDLTADKVIADFGHPDVIWASPDCSSYSVAAIARHRCKNERTGNLDPKSDYAEMSDLLNMHTHTT